MRRALVGSTIMLALLACGGGESVPSDPNVGGDPSVDLEPTDVPHVTWAEIEALILSGAVLVAAETHSNWAILTLRDGRSVASREPERGAVFRLIERCGAPCRGMGIAIE
jgi:hypothetical protein